MIITTGHGYKKDTRRVTEEWVYGELRNRGSRLTGFHYLLVYLRGGGVGGGVQFRGEGFRQIPIYFKGGASPSLALKQAHESQVGVLGQRIGLDHGSAVPRRLFQVSFSFEKAPPSQRARQDIDLLKRARFISAQPR